MSAAPIDGDNAPSTLAFLLSQVGIYASGRFAERIGELDLQPPEFRVLNIVDAGEGESQQAIAEAIGAPPSRMVAIVDGLEQRGLVERCPHASDRRVHVLHLTAKGRKLLARGREVAAEHERDITKGMSEAERKRLTALLQKVVAAQGIRPGVHPGFGGSS